MRRKQKKTWVLKRKPPIRIMKLLITLTTVLSLSSCIFNEDSKGSVASFPKRDYDKEQEFISRDIVRITEVLNHQISSDSALLYLLFEHVNMFVSKGFEDTIIAKNYGLAQSIYGTSVDLQKKVDEFTDVVEKNMLFGRQDHADFNEDILEFIALCEKQCGNCLFPNDVLVLPPYEGHIPLRESLYNLNSIMIKTLIQSRAKQALICLLGLGEGIRVGKFDPATQ